MSEDGTLEPTTEDSRKDASGATYRALLDVVRAECPERRDKAVSEAKELAGGGCDHYTSLLREVERLSQEVADLRHSVSRDAMTSLLNRRGFDESLHREVARHNRHGEGLSVVLFDLDNLKPLNDTHGHAAGDDAIIAVASAISEQLRETDVAARLGGDEFAVLLPAAASAQAHQVALRLRAAIESRSVCGEPIAVSVGVGTARGCPTTARALLFDADFSLYTDKRARKVGRRVA